MHFIKLGATMKSSSAASTILRLLTLCSLYHAVMSSPTQTRMVMLPQSVTIPSFIDAGDIEHFVACYANDSGYHGVKATLSVSELPPLKPNQMSSSFMTLANSNGPLNTIEVGWHVSPERYNDSQTRFYVNWMGVEDNRKGGCYNLECPGFLLQDDSPIIPGQVLSIPRRKQKYISITIYQDLTTRFWWLVYDDETHQGVTVGHWPKILFNGLNTEANMVEFGGAVQYPKGSLSPAMGNGNFPSKGIRQRAAVISDLQAMDNNGTFNRLLPGELTVGGDDLCYNSTMILTHHGLDFYYGGPGNCMT